MGENMAEDIKTSVQNFNTDAQTAEEVVNGNESGEVIARLGRKYPTLPAAIEEIMKAGGYFDSYATLAEANAKVAEIPLNRLVRVLSATDGGDYYKASSDATSLTKSAYDPVAQAKADATLKANTAESNANLFASQRLSQFLSFDFHSDDKYSFVVIDSEGNIIEANDLEGNLIQKNPPSTIKKDFHTMPSVNTDVFIITDESGNILNQSNTGGATDFSNLQKSPLVPIPLKNKEVFSEFGKITVQLDYSADLYNKSTSVLIPNHQAVYAFYDALVAKFPEFMSVETLGQDALGNLIKQYTYTPRLLNSVADEDTFWTASELAPPKLVITTGVHGGTEKDAILNMMILMQEILGRANEIEDAFILKQARLVIIPCVTPSSIDNGTRNNHRGINVNRNARDGFELGNEGGTTPLSEPECAIAVSLPELHPDASCFIDHHNFAGNGYVAWFSTIKESTLKVLKNIAHEINANAQINYTYMGSKTVRLGKNANGTIARDWQNISNKKAYLLESPSETSSYPLFQNRQLGLHILRYSLTTIFKNEQGV